MKGSFRISLLFAVFLLVINVFPVYAVGEGNVDNGGGSLGNGTSSNFWSPGNEGVRVTVVRGSDKSIAAIPIDLTNKNPTDVVHFHKLSKLQYSDGAVLTPSMDVYIYANPGQTLPKIISSQSLGAANIEEIKSYFTDEQVIRSIAAYVGMDFDVLINGEYKLMIEPIAYVTYQDVFFAMTATEAALYDEITNGGLRSMLPTVCFQNLPLAMFLETADLGYSAWDGPTSGVRSNQEIKSALGLGVIKFQEKQEELEVSTYDYEYRVNTEVITSVRVSGGKSDPDNSVKVTFKIDGKSHTVNNVYYPQGDSQVVWVRWTTPETPKTITISVSVSGSKKVSQSVITAKIVDLDENPPPNPVADDRNDSYQKPAIPSKEEKTYAEWTVWRPWWYEYWVWHSGDEDEDGYWCDHGFWEFDLDEYYAELSGSMRIDPDDKNPTANGDEIKSGYGINQTVQAEVRTNNSAAATKAQNAVTYFPEFQYEGFWRLLEPTTGGYHSVFEFKNNKYSTYNRRTHFTPIWMPDGAYTPHTWLIDSWTPAGMLSMNLTDSVTIRGNLWSDWHISPQNPE